MNDVFNPALAAQILADAWHAGEQLTELPLDKRPTSVEQGYDIQEHLLTLLNQPLAGWKLGVGSPNLQKQSGVGRSIAGRVLGSRVYRDGDTVPLPNAAPVTIEFEIAYILGRDITPIEDATLAGAIADTLVTFELVLARFVDRRAVGWPSFTADNAGFHALVVGPTIGAQEVANLRNRLVVSLDGKEVARSVQGDDMTDPLQALRDLIAIARERRFTLPKGSIISTGTVSKPFTIKAPEAEVSASFLDRQLTFRTKVSPR